MGTKTRHYAIQDCVECDANGDHSFKCDAQVSHTVKAAVAAAWGRFCAHHRALTGREPSAATDRDFHAALGYRREGVRSFRREITKSCSVTVEILERESV